MSIAALLLFIRVLGLTLPLWVVAGWSAAEAVLWFIVADVPVSWIAVRSGTRAGLLAALVAAVAAIPGGLLVYWWAGYDLSGAVAAMTALPAIDGDLIRLTADRFAHAQWLAMFAGSFAGTPYKLYALAAGQQGASLALFLIATPLVRLPRFLLAALVAGTISRLLSHRLDRRQRLLLLGGVWLLFYAVYFSIMPG